MKASGRTAKSQRSAIRVWSPHPDLASLPGITKLNAGTQKPTSSIHKKVPLKQSGQTVSIRRPLCDDETTACRGDRFANAANFRRCRERKKSSIHREIKKVPGTVKDSAFSRLSCAGSGNLI
jgi:hypothetical protein